MAQGLLQTATINNNNNNNNKVKRRESYNNCILISMHMSY